MTVFSSPEDVIAKLAREDYLCSQNLATVVFLAHHLKKPLFVEGPAGVGKTELAKVLAKSLHRDLIRLQCYEGLDEGKALYEWEYGKQLLYTQILRDKISEVTRDTETLADAVHRLAQEDNIFFSREFILPRPLLRAILSPQPTVLLIDEIDKSDSEFEAFLLEVLSDFQVSVPELGTLTAVHRPWVVVTSNSSRELSDALRRRCLYLRLDLPDASRERDIIRLKVPGVEARLAQQVVALQQDYEQFRADFPAAGRMSPHGMIIATRANRPRRGGSFLARTEVD